MAYRTFGELKEQIEEETDIQGEEFIQPNELVRYINTGVTIVESEIIKLGLREKYLQTEDFISVVQGQSDYDLPSDIIENKIRKIVYRNNTNIYTVRPLKSEASYELEDLFNFYATGEEYYYMLYKTGETQKLRLVPIPSMSVTNALRIIYFKDLNRYDEDSTNCDIPEVCYEFLVSYVRYRIYKKETHVNTEIEKQDMAMHLELMRETLQNQVADPDMDLVDKDLTLYEEMS